MAAMVVKSVTAVKLERPLTRSPLSLGSTRLRPEGNASPGQEAAEIFSAGFAAGAMGRLTVKTDPLPTSLATSTEP